MYTKTSRVWKKTESDLVVNYADKINTEECQIVQIGTNQGYSIVVIYRLAGHVKPNFKKSSVFPWISVKR